MTFLARFVCSAGSEWWRQCRLKELFLDSRDTFKLFAITRYLFSGVFLGPAILAANLSGCLMGTSMNIVLSIMIF